MAPGEIVVSVVLGLAALVVVLSAVGLMRMRHPLDRLHYVGVATTLAPFLFAVAALIQNQSAIDSIKSVLVMLVLGLTSPAMTHVLARAIRARDTGALEPEEGELGPGAARAQRRARGDAS